MFAFLSFMLLNPVAFEGATVVPMDRGAVLRDQVVVVGGGRIAALGRRVEIAIPKDAQRIDARGKFLVPGLVDTHIHIPTEASDEASAADELALFLAHGVTTARVMIGQAERLALRGKIARGELLGPTLFVASPPLGVAAGTLPGVPKLETPEDARRFAHEMKKAGYDGVKVLDSLSREEYDAFVAGAREAGLPSRPRRAFASPTPWPPWTTCRPSSLPNGASSKRKRSLASRRSSPPTTP